MPNFPALISSAHTLRPFQPGVFTAKGKAERDLEREEAQRQALAQEALQRGQLGLGFGRLGAQVRGQDIRQQQFEATQRARLEEEQRKLKNAAMQEWAKARLSGDQAAMSVASQRLKELGFRIEGMAPPQEPVTPEPVQLKPFAPPALSPTESALAEDVKLEPSVGTGRTPEQEVKAKAIPLTGRGPGGALSATGPQPQGTRIYDSNGQVVWDESNPVVEKWYRGRVNQAFGGMVDKYKDDPEALAAVIAGHEHASGLLGTGIGADKAAEEGMKLATSELDRMGKLERAKIIANKPRAATGPKEEDFAYKSKVDAITKLGQHGKIQSIREQEAILTDALQKARRGDAIGDVQGIGLYIQSISGKAVTDREYRRLAESTGMNALIARWKGWFTGEGPISEEQMMMLRSSLAQTLKRLSEYKKNLAMQAHRWVMNDTRPMKESNRKQEAKNAAEVFYEKWGNEMVDNGPTNRTVTPQKKKDAAPKKPLPKGGITKLLKDAM